MWANRITKTGPRERMSDRGFTIVELLVVIVIIGILASITIVAYNGIQNRANDVAVQANLKNIGSQIGLYMIDNTALPATNSELTSLGMKVTGSSYGSHYVSSGQNYNMAYCRNTTTNSYAIVAASKSGKVFVVTDGTVKEGVGPMQTIATTCSNNGFSGASTLWFFSAGAWQYSIQY
mgnify:CR=1 FL=1